MRNENRLDVYIHIVDANSNSPQLDRIEALLGNMIVTEQDLENKMADFKTEFDALTVQVTANTDAEASALIVINGIAAQIAASAGDPVATKALADKLKASADALAAAVAANTPKPPVA